MLTNTPSLIIFQISVASIFIAVTSAYLARWSPSFDFVIFANISVLQLILLFKADDLISVFFLLELLNSLIIYSFLFSYDTKAQRHAVSSSRMAVACAYQIVLNFFSSILLYSGVNTYIAVTGGPKLCFAHLFNDCAYSYAPLLIVLGLFIKLGTGPWIFYKINIYKNMNWVLAYLYSGTYLSVVLVFFLNLFFYYGMSLELTSITLLTAFILAASTSFSSFAFHTSNAFVFISFSSLLNLSIFILQALSVFA